MGLKFWGVKSLLVVVMGAVVPSAGAWTIHRSFRNGYPAGAQGVVSRQTTKSASSDEAAVRPAKVERMGTGSQIAQGTGAHTGLLECVAHRGYWNAEIPENTVEAIRRAYDCGANWVETDFNLEPDGRMLCYHDAKRRDEVIKPPFHVPTVDEVLAVVPKDRGIQCEIKRYGRGYAEKFDRAVRAAGLSEANVIVSSFNETALRDFKKRKPSYRTLFLTGVTTATTPEALIAKGRAMRVFSICPGAVQAKAAGWTAAESGKIRAAGFSFRFWGVNTPEQLAYAAEVKAEAFTCNFFEEAFRWAEEAGVALTPPTVVPSP